MNHCLKRPHVPSFHIAYPWHTTVWYKPVFLILRDNSNTNVVSASSHVLSCGILTEHGERSCLFLSGSVEICKWQTLILTWRQTAMITSPDQTPFALSLEQRAVLPVYCNHAVVFSSPRSPSWESLPASHVISEPVAALGSDGILDLTFSHKAALKNTQNLPRELRRKPIERLVSPKAILS